MSKTRLSRSYWLGVSVALALGLGSVGIAVAQSWEKPISRPPLLNPNQPLSTDQLTGYVRKSVSEVQAIRGPVDIAQGTDPARPSFFGSADTATNISIETRDTALSPLFSWPNSYIGIAGYGSQYGIYGESSANSGDTRAAVIARSSNLTSDQLAGLFLGPISVSPNLGDNGSITLDNTFTTKNGFICDNASCVLNSGDTHWLEGTNDSGGTGVYTDANGVGLDIDVGASTAVVEGPAVFGSSELGIGVGAYGTTGIYAYLSGVDDRQYIAAAGINNGGLQRIGARGISDGYVGSVNFGTTSDPSYDHSAGVYACTRDSAGDAVNAVGVYGSGGEYAGYFSGSSLIEGGLSAFTYGGELDTAFGNGGVVERPLNREIRGLDVDLTDVYTAGLHEFDRGYGTKQSSIDGSLDGVFFDYGLGQFTGFQGPDEAIGTYNDIAIDDAYVYAIGSATSKPDSDQLKLDTIGDVGKYATTDVGPDDLPVIAYYDETNSSLKLLKCGNNRCTSGNTITTLVTGVPITTSFDVVVRNDNTPFVVYPNPSVLAISCTTPTCSSSNAPGNLVSSVDAMVAPKVILGPDGYPVVLYGNDVSNNLVLAKCQNANCTQVQKRDIVTTGDPASEGNFDFVIPPDNLPVVVYFDTEFGADDFNMYKCDNILCSTGTSYFLDSGAYPMGLNPAIALKSDGLPIITYRYARSAFSTHEIIVLSCGDAICSAGSNVRTVLDSGGGSSLDITVDENGLAMIVGYIDGFVRSYYCFTTDCDGNYLATEFTAGGSMGDLPDISMAYQDGRDVPFITFYHTGSTDPDHDLVAFSCSTKDCSTEGWHIEKRDKVTGALDTTFGDNGIFNGANTDYVSGEARKIVIDSNFLYTVGIDGLGVGKVEKRKKNGDICNWAANCDGTSFGNGGFGYRNIYDYADAATALAYDEANRMLYVGSGSRIGSGNNYWNIHKISAVDSNFQGGFGSSGTIESANGSIVRSLLVADNNLFVAGYQMSGADPLWTVEKRRLDNGLICNGANGCNNGAFLTNGYYHLANQTEAYDMNYSGGDLYIVGYETNAGRDWRIERRDVGSGVLDTAFGSTGTGYIISSDGDTPHSIVSDREALYIGGTNDSGIYRLEKRVKDIFSDVISIGSTTLQTTDIAALFCKAGLGFCN